MSMKVAEVRNLKPEELENKLAELKKDLFTLRMQHATNQLENPIRLRALKRDIARVKTVLRETQSGEVS